MAARIREGDLVVVVSGDDRGKRGKVLRVLPDAGRVVVEGVNLVFKHLRKSPKNPQGGRMRREASVHLSKVMPVDPDTSRGTRVGMRVEGGRKVRVGRRSGAVIGGAPRKGEAGATPAEE
jgi:large subunit ribosomal protein L24